MSEFLKSIVSLVNNAIPRLAGKILHLPAHADLAFQAAVQGAVCETKLSIPVIGGYNFYLDLYFKQNDNQDRERVRKLAGTGQYDRVGRGAKQINTGLSIPVRLSVRRIDGGETNRQSLTVYIRTMNSKDLPPIATSRL